MPKKTNKNSRRSFIANVTKGVIGASMIPTIITARDRKRNYLEMIRDHKKSVFFK